MRLLGVRFRVEMKLKAAESQDPTGVCLCLSRDWLSSGTISNGPNSNIPNRSRLDLPCHIHTHREIYTVQVTYYMYIYICIYIIYIYIRMTADLQYLKGLTGLHPVNPHT